MAVDDEARRIGRFIALRRKEALGLSQAELAERLGWSRKTLSEVENGRRALRKSEFTHVSQELGVSVDELRSGEAAEGAAKVRRADELEFDAASAAATLSSLSTEELRLFRDFLDGLLRTRGAEDPDGDAAPRNSGAVASGRE